MKKRKRLFISILLTLLLMCVSHSLWLIEQPITLSFDISGKGSLELDVLYAKRVEVGVPQMNRISQVIKLTDEVKNITMPLPIKRVEKLRFNFRKGIASVQISNIVLKGRKNLHLGDMTYIEAKELNNLKAFENGMTFTLSSKPASMSFKQNIKLKKATEFDFEVFIILLTLSFLLTYKAVQYVSLFKIRDNHSRIDIVFVVCFFIVLFIPMLNITEDAFSMKENRMLAKYEHLIIDGKLNNHYGKNFENWFNDRFYQRRFFIKTHDKLKAKINQALGGKSQGNDRVLIGDDNWLFWAQDNALRNFQNITDYSPDELKAIADYLVSINEWCKKNGKHFYYFIAPDKHRIYGEYILKLRKVAPDSQSRTQKLITYLRENTDVNVIYPYDRLRDEKQKGDLLYYKNDTHWNLLGAYYGYQELMAQILKDYPQIIPVQITAYEQMKMPEGDMVKMHEAIKPDNETVYKKPVFNQEYTCPEDLDEKEYTCQNNAPKTNLSIAFFRDSFTQLLLPYITTTFNKSAYFWHYNITSANLSYLLNNADIIVMEQVERFVPQLIQQTPIKD